MKLIILFVAALTAACSVAAPPTAPSSQPAPGVPARLELSAAPGLGAAGGTVAIQARVIDAYAAAVPGAAVTFQASAGTLSAAVVATDVAGVARVTLSEAPAGVAAIAARTDTVHAETTVAVQPLLVPPAPPVADPVLGLSVRRLGPPLAYRVAVTFSADDVATRGIAYTFLDEGAALNDVVVQSTQRTLDHTFAHAGLFTVQVDATLANGHTISAREALVVQP